MSACYFGPIDNTPPYDYCGSGDYVPFYEETDTNSSYLYVECSCQDSMIDLATKLAPYHSVQHLTFTCNESQFDAIPLMPSVKTLKSSIMTSNIMAFPNLEIFIDSDGSSYDNFMETPFVSELTLLPNLKKIEVHNLFEFPDEIGTIPLEEFKIVYRGYAGRNGIPSNLHKLTNLTSLELNWYGSESFIIPDNYGDLINLQHLAILGLDTDIPYTFNQLTNLKSVSFRNLKISTDLPNIFENMDSLVNIDIYRTSISINSQKNIYKTPNLKVLKLQECDITEIESEIGNLTALEKLTIYSHPYGTRLSILPQSMSNLSNLKELELYSPNFTQLPNVIIGLKNNLESLVIYYSPLMSIPADIGDFTQLKHLTLYDCQLTSLPSEIQNLSNTLETLNLVRNSFDEATKQQIKSWLPNTAIDF